VRPSDEHVPVAPDAAYVDELRALAAGYGITHVGVAPATVMSRARAVLHERRDAGLHDGMQFTYRDPERSTDPGRAVTGAAAVLVGARPYLIDGEPDVRVPEQAATAPTQPLGRIARYARDDHYGALREGLWAVAHRLRRDGWRAVAFADDNSLVDREAAHRAGLGWYGKSANLLLPGAGSFFVLGSVVTTAPLPVAGSLAADGCGSCRRCIDGCPTGAIVAPGVVDASRCLSWLLQKPGTFPAELRTALGDRMYGCDDCQEVCPPTVRLGPRHRSSPSGEVQVDVPVLELLEASDDEVLRRWGRWYIAGRDPRWLRRNALVVLGNVGDGTDPRTRRAVLHALRGDDPVVRAHAVWAARRLGLDHLLPVEDTDPDVARELAAAVAPR